MGKARNVIISGLTAAGKTTHAKLLCKDFGLKYVSASQILLNLSGLKSEQPPDFWITPKGREISNRISWRQIDSEFRRLESKSCETVFDCQSLPWLCSKDCMSIWIESSLASRIMKAVVSFIGNGTLKSFEIEEGIRVKDWFAREQIMANYNIDLFRNRDPFKLIVDISTFISAPTEAASRVSIVSAHEIISSAVGYYFYGTEAYLTRLREQLALYGDIIIQHLVRP